MNWSHVKLIFHREVRDQLRDRRTMFTICVLPILVYPLMGMVMMQLAQFHREQHVTIGLVGYENWPGEHPLITTSENDAIRWKRLSPAIESNDSEDLLRESGSDAIVCIPENIFQDGNWVILEWRDPVGLRGCGFFHIEEDKIILQRGYWDKLSFLKFHGLPE